VRATWKLIKHQGRPFPMFYYACMIDPFERNMLESIFNWQYFGFTVTVPTMLREPRAKDLIKNNGFILFDDKKRHMPFHFDVNYRWYSFSVAWLPVFNADILDIGHMKKMLAREVQATMQQVCNQGEQYILSLLQEHYRKHHEAPPEKQKTRCRGKTMKQQTLKQLEIAEFSVNGEETVSRNVATAIAPVAAAYQIMIKDHDQLLDLVKNIKLEGMNDA